MGEEVDRLDKAFEWLVLFIGISYATIIQFLTWILEPPVPQQETGTAHVLMAVVRLTFIPLLIIILIWLGKFIAAEQKKMFFRKLAWGWGMFQLAAHIISTMFLATIDLPREQGNIITTFLQMAIIPCVVLVSATTYAIYRKIIGLYKKATIESVFWRSRWWDHGATCVTILSMILFILFVYYLPRPI